MNHHPPTTQHQQRRRRPTMAVVLLITTVAAGLLLVIILTFTSQQLHNNNNNNHDDDQQTQTQTRQRKRRRLQGVMGSEGDGLLHHLDPKTVEFKGGTDNNMVYIPPNNDLQLRHPLLHLQQQQQQQPIQQQQPMAPEYNNNNNNNQYPVSPQQHLQQVQQQQQQQQLQSQQFQAQPPLPQQQQQQPVQQQFDAPQPQIPQENIDTIINNNNPNNSNNLLANPNNNNNNIASSNPIQVVTSQQPQPQPPQQAAAASSLLSASTTNTNTPSSLSTIIKPYNINNILQTLQAFRYQGFFFIYNSSTNEFVIVHATPVCDKGCVRIYRIASILAYALRTNFPERFPRSEGDNNVGAVAAGNGNAGEGGGRGGGDLVFVISTGDVPRLHQYCLSQSTNYCSSTDFGPILQFGSIFVNTDYMPSMIAMPQPVRPHMPCFDEWQLYGRVCKDLQPALGPDASDPTGAGAGGEFNGIASFASGLVFGQEFGLVNTPTYWNEELIPQIIWRGTDFVFLHTMFPKMRRPAYEKDITKKEWTRRGGENKRWAIDALWEMGEMLQPRWRGVLLTSEAELEAEEFREGGDVTLPWVNIKFASCNFNGKKVDAAENPDFQKLQEVGIRAIGERVNMQEQAKYRYHIDLGGGGGTSWTGTIEKLALPGVLFHHVTPTKDWFYDRLEPWVHYIPVDSDLTDLREKFEWAESHPVEAQKIAEAGTDFARWIGTPEGFGELYQQHLVAPLRGIINAYQPSPDASDAGKSVLDIIKERGSPEYTVVSKCSGGHQYSCTDLNGKIPSG